MADLMNNKLQGYSFPLISGISMQYHITVECDQACKHCYMYNSEYYHNQKTNSLSKESSFELLKQFNDMLKKYGLLGVVSITGGDPILSPCFWDLLEFCKKECDRFVVNVLGNPFHIDYKTACRLKTMNVKGYQISIDGMRNTHDEIRKKGSFDESIRALKDLRRAGLQTMVMTTVSKHNSKDVISLMRYLSKCDFVLAYGFDRMTPIGNGSEMADELFSPKEYREFLFDLCKEEAFSTELNVNKKENLWKLLYYELGLLDPFNEHETKKCSGCVAGVGTISVLADGTCFSCRRLEIPIGKFPENSLEEIFINNKLTPKIRSLEEYENCVDCELKAFCRGCLATKYAVGNSIWAKEPYCWKEFG